MSHPPQHNASHPAASHPAAAHPAAAHPGAAGHHTGDPGWDHVLDDMDRATHDLEIIAVDLFVQGIENACHYLNEAGKGLANAAYLVAEAAEVVGWIGSALHWLGHIIPGVSLLGDAVDKVGEISSEKAIEAGLHALAIEAHSMQLAALGWDARSAGHVTKQSFRRAYEISHEVYNTGTSIITVLFH